MVSEMVQYSATHIHIQQMTFIFRKSLSYPTIHIHKPAFTSSLLNSYSGNHTFNRNNFRSYSGILIHMQQLFIHIQEYKFIFNNFFVHIQEYKFMFSIFYSYSAIITIHIQEKLFLVNKSRKPLRAKQFKHGGCSS